MAFSALHPTLGRIDATLPDLGKSSDWTAVHRVKPRPTLRCTDCRHGVHAKVSPKGLRHFAHNPGRPSDCLWLNESLEHHFLKLELATAIRTAGWHAELEVRGPDGLWRADVLASSHDGTRRMAWETQLSPITDEDLHDRTSCYREAGIDVCWVTPNSRVAWIGVEPSVRVVEPREDAPWTVVEGLIRFDSARGSWVNVDHLGLAEFVRCVIDGQAATHRVLPRYRRILAGDGHVTWRMTWTAPDYVAAEARHEAMRKAQDEEKRRGEEAARLKAEQERLAEAQRQQEAEARRVAEEQRREAEAAAERARLEELRRQQEAQRKLEYGAYVKRLEEDRLQRERETEAAEVERLRLEEAERTSATEWWEELSPAQVEELKEAIVEPVLKREGTRITFDDRGPVSSAGYGIEVFLRGRRHGVMRPSPGSLRHLRFGETIYVRNAREAALMEVGEFTDSFNVIHLSLPDHEQGELF